MKILTIKMFNFSILSELHECPMCEEVVEPEQLLDIEDIRPYIYASSSATLSSTGALS